MDILTPTTRLLTGLLRAPIGSFGDVVFEVSIFKTFTFDDYQRQSKARYAKHELINEPTALEYLGEDTEKITLEITLHVDLGVNPAEAASRLRALCLNGEAEYLIVGNRVLGNCRWVITDLTEKATAWDNAGNIMVSKLNVTFETYTERFV